MNKETDWVVVGRFGRPQGLKGLIRVISFTEPQDNILSYSCWYCKNQGGWQPLKRLAIERTNKFIVVQLDGYSDRDQAAFLTNKEIVIFRSELPCLAPGEYYWHDLIGMRVIGKEGFLFGRVADMLSTGSNDVLVVTGENQRHLIPYLLNQYVIEVDVKKGAIIVDWDVNF